MSLLAPSDPVIPSADRMSALVSSNQHPPQLLAPPAGFERSLLVGWVL